MSHYDCSNHRLHRLTCNHTPLKHDLIFHCFRDSSIFSGSSGISSTIVNIEANPWRGFWQNLIGGGVMVGLAWLFGGRGVCCGWGNGGGLFAGGLGDGLGAGDGVSAGAGLTRTPVNSDADRISKYEKQISRLEKRKADADKLLTKSADNPKKLARAEEKAAKVNEDAQKLLDEITNYEPSDGVNDERDQERLDALKDRLQAIIDGTQPATQDGDTGSDPLGQITGDDSDILDNIAEAETLSDLTGLLSDYDNMSPEEKEQYERKFADLLDGISLGGLEKLLPIFKEYPDLQALISAKIAELQAAEDEGEAGSGNRAQSAGSPQGASAQGSRTVPKTAAERFEGVNNLTSNLTKDDIDEATAASLVDSKDFNSSLPIDKAHDESPKTRDVLADAESGYTISEEKYSEGEQTTNFPLYISIKDKDNGETYHYKCVKTIEKDGKTYSVYKSPDGVNEYALAVKNGKMQLVQPNTFGGFGIPDTQNKKTIGV